MSDRELQSLWADRILAFLTEQNAVDTNSGVTMGNLFSDNWWTICMPILAADLTPVGLDRVDFRPLHRLRGRLFKPTVTALVQRGFIQEQQMGSDDVYYLA